MADQGNDVAGKASSGSVGGEVGFGQPSSAATLVVGLEELVAQWGDFSISKNVEEEVFTFPELPLETGEAQEVDLVLWFRNYISAIVKKWSLGLALIQDHNMACVDVYAEVDGFMVLDDLVSRWISSSIPMGAKKGNFVRDVRLFVVDYLWGLVANCSWMGRSVKMKVDHNHILNDGSVESSGLKGVETAFFAPTSG